MGPEHISSVFTVQHHAVPSSRHKNTTEQLHTTRQRISVIRRKQDDVSWVSVETHPQLTAMAASDSDLNKRITDKTALRISSTYSTVNVTSSSVCGSTFHRNVDRDYWLTQCNSPKDRYFTCTYL